MNLTRSTLYHIKIWITISFQREHIWRQNKLKKNPHYLLLLYPDPPEVVAEQASVHTGPGYSVDISCIVYSRYIDCFGLLSQKSVIKLYVIMWNALRTYSFVRPVFIYVRPSGMTQLSLCAPITPRSTCSSFVSILVNRARMTSFFFNWSRATLPCYTILGTYD